MKLSTHISSKIGMKKGFTLIELLVVIGILGILAAGLLAAIDPLEQLKKGRDTNKRAVAVELLNASTRYYAVYGSMPVSSYGGAVTGATAPVNVLTATGELKTTFMVGLPTGTNNALILNMNSSSASVCFDPESKSISGDPTTIFSATGLPPTVGTCGVTAACYFCVQ